MHACKILGGAFALAVLVTGCSRQPKPATAGRTPTFESSVPSDSASSRVDEQNLCDTLSEDANVKIEDTPTGAIVTFKAKDGGVNQPVRNEVRLLQDVLSANGTPLSKAQGDRGCGLSEIRAENVTVTVHETPEGMEVHLMATDPTRVDNVRQNARLTADRLR